MNDEVGAAAATLDEIRAAGARGLTLDLHRSCDVTLSGAPLTTGGGRSDARRVGRLHITAHGATRPLQKELDSFVKGSAAAHFKLRYDVFFALAAKKTS